MLLKIYFTSLASLHGLASFRAPLLGISAPGLIFEHTSPIYGNGVCPDRQSKSTTWFSQIFSGPGNLALVNVRRDKVSTDDVNLIVKELNLAGQQKFFYFCKFNLEVWQEHIFWAL